MSTGRAASSCLALAVVAAMAALLHGCNIVGPAAYLIAGPGQISAQYKLEDVPTVVFLDDRRNIVNPTSLRRVIADRATQELMIHAKLTQMIRPADAMALAAQADRNDKLLALDEIGRRVGAQQLIYVEMVGFRASPDGSTPRPYAGSRVRVIDVENQTRLFPPMDDSDDARVVEALMPAVDPESLQSRGRSLKLFEALANTLGSNIAKLFYKHERVDLGETLNSR